MSQVAITFSPVGKAPASQLTKRLALVDVACEVTITGGMPFFGGPGNNYSGHAIADMVGRLRAESGLG